MSLLLDPRFFHWGERLAPGSQKVLSHEFVATEDQRPWIRPLRVALSDGESIKSALLGSIPHALGLSDVLELALPQLPELAALLDAIVIVLLGFSADDTACRTPLMGLVFDEEAEMFIVVAGPERPPQNLPVELQSIVATTGGWLDIALPPLWNFEWFLVPDAMVGGDVGSSFFPALLEVNMGEEQVRDSDALPFSMWNQLADCVLLGEVANGDVLILVRSGSLAGNVYLLSHEAPGPLNHLDPKDHLTWIRWVLRCGISVAKGKGCSCPWFY